MACKECERKEGVIQMYKAGHVRREDMAEQIQRLIQDRDHWRSIATKGSRTTSKTINDLREKLARAEGELALLKERANPLPANPS